jgi:aminopeptidase N
MLRNDAARSGNGPRGIGRPLRTCFAAALLASATLLISLRPSFADRPYAPHKDYDLTHISTSLSLNLDERRIFGDTTQDLIALRDGVTEFGFDSAQLEIQSVTLNGQVAKFQTTDAKLLVTLPQATHTGDKYQIAIRYTGQPKRGIYFVLPDKNYPNRPAEIWTQGEAEDTHYYIPLYDYPNDRTTSEMTATVPKDWITVSNGKLVSVTDGPDGQKTWHWRQDEPLSTYLISLVAGQFVEKKDSWRGIPLTYEVPRGMGDTIAPSFDHTKQMLDFFSDSLSVPYPWEQYAQANVDEFIEGGMENTSATTLTTDELVESKLAAETHEGEDFLVAHEMFHQWFGDLVTCKDWANLWLNEGFATFAEYWWQEHEFGADEAAYTRWRDARSWMGAQHDFGVPIVTHDFTDSMEYEGNIYTKAGLVLQMLREQLGDAAFLKSLHNYLEANRNQNVVTADLVKAIEQTTGSSVDQFFDQWIYGAGAPRFRVTASYDEDAHQEKLDVAQIQKVEGHVGLFSVPIEIEITAGGAKKSYWINVSKAEESFTFPASEKPDLVLFDKGDKILKSVEFDKSPAEWIYQLQHADNVPDRADATIALGALSGDNSALEALGHAAVSDPFWAIRVQAIYNLARFGTPEAAQKIIATLDAPEPWVREAAVSQLRTFTNVPGLAARLAAIYQNDPAYGVRSEALVGLAQQKTPAAFDTLSAALNPDSPRDLIRNAALRGFGILGDERAVPLLLEWSALGKPLDSRPAALGALTHLGANNPEVEARLISYAGEPYRDVRERALRALGERGDTSAIAPLEALVQRGQLDEDSEQVAQQAITRLRRVEARQSDKQ